MSTSVGSTRNTRKRTSEAERVVCDCDRCHGRLVTKKTYRNHRREQQEQNTSAEDGYAGGTVSAAPRYPLESIPVPQILSDATSLQPGTSNLCEEPIGHSLKRKATEDAEEIALASADASEVSGNLAKRACSSLEMPQPGSAVGLSPDESVMDSEMASVDPSSSEDRELGEPFLFDAMAVDCSGNIHDHANNETLPNAEDIEHPESQTSTTAAATLSPSADETLESAESQHRDHELAEILRQVHIRESLQSHASSDEEHDEGLHPSSQPSYGPGEQDPTISDNIFQATPSRLEHIQWSQEFITLIQSATLDNDKLDSATLERLRNPLPPRTDAELEEYKESLDLYFLTSSAPESIYENLRRHMEQYHNTEILSLHRVRQLVEELTGISPVYDDMCIKGCHAFTGPFADKTECDTCGQSRYLPGTADKKKKVPRQQACTIPLGPQIQALRQSKEGSMAMRYRSQKMEELINAEASGAEIVYDDIFCGSDIRNLGETMGFTATEDDTFVGLSVDGAQLYQDKKSDTWFGIWIVYDYDPATRYKRRHVLPAFIIPGSEKPKNVESYLFRSFYHLSALQRENGGAGLQVYDAMKDAIVSSRIFFLFGTADAVFFFFF